MSDNRVRQNYHEECESEINKQINRELYASYVYLSMGYYFDRDDVSLPGFSKHFKDQSLEELGHAEKLMKISKQKRRKDSSQKHRGKPEKDDWESSRGALEAALALEKSLCDFLDTEFLYEQVKEIKEVSDFISSWNRAGPGLGEYLFDKHEMNLEKRETEETEVPAN
ncbi:UNVERIFIED_CONTAM: Soma ferritin [Trichonephila clavipes]